MAIENTNGTIILGNSGIGVGDTGTVDSVTVPMIVPELDPENCSSRKPWLDAVVKYTPVALLPEILMLVKFPTWPENDAEML